MTAEALVCRFFLDTSPAPEAVGEAVELMSRNRPNRSQVNYYYWYYATLAMQLSGRREWTSWNKALRARLLGMQRQKGELKGSFDPTGIWSGYGGRIYSTALATLCLESYYRYLPLKTEHNRRLDPALGLTPDGANLK